MPSPIDSTATILFGLALVHTFSTGYFTRVASRFREGSVGENLFHLLGEVEVVFGVWAGLFILAMSFERGWEETVHYVDTLNYTEPLFVFAIMCVAATKPILNLAERFMHAIAKALPLPDSVAIFATLMIVGPLLGSFITEPAAMTLTALMLKSHYFDGKVSDRFRHLALAVLFVNVSIGGVLTSFAAPPVLMVASHWDWSTAFMATHFGWKAVIAILINTIGATLILRKELLVLEPDGASERSKSPIVISAIHLVFLAGVVVNAHHPSIFLGLFMLFLGVVTVTREYQDELKIREGLLVGFFLAGLVVLGKPQAWWLSPILERLSAHALFVGTTLLTAITDNAALTYLGSQVEGLADLSKFSLVAGAVAGGGLTVIANAPNPAGYSILLPSFGPSGIAPMKLFAYALVPTFVAMACLWLF